MSFYKWNVKNVIKSFLKSKCKFNFQNSNGETNFGEINELHVS
jgi:hypothetical protein